MSSVLALQQLRLSSSSFNGGVSTAVGAKACISCCCAGSPIISRQGWKTLLAEQGFTDVLVAGESLPAPALLSRQSVVLGVSDGAIQVARKQPVQAQKREKGGLPVPAAPGQNLLLAAPQQQLAAPSTAAIIQVTLSVYYNIRSIAASCKG